MAQRAVEAYVALGSNLGDRAEHLRAALRALDARPGVALVAVSPVYETEPVGGPPQGDYLNAVARLLAALPPRALLERLLAIEASRGRARDGARDGPRSLDLDLLLYGERVIDEPDLVIPHPRLCQRAFVLAPLADLAPDLVHPTRRETIEKLLRGASGSVRRFTEEEL